MVLLLFFHGNGLSPGGRLHEDNGLPLPKAYVLNSQ